MVILVETKVRPRNKHKILNCIPNTWDADSNYEYSTLGRVWLCWNRKVWTCQAWCMSMQQITSTTTNKSGLQILITVVYGSNRKSRSANLWKELIGIHQTYGHLPWTVAGDFNVVIFSGKDWR